MVRKTRKTITAETPRLCQDMVELGQYKVSHIASMLGISMRTISNLMKKIQNNEEFVARQKKFKMTIKNRQENLSEIEQSLFNEMALNNSLTQGEIKEVLVDRYGSSISQPTIHRKLKS